MPLTSDAALFRALARYGAELVDLHLMRDEANAVGKSELAREGTINQGTIYRAPTNRSIHDIRNLITTYPQRGSKVVASGYPQYTEPTESQGGRVRINGEQYFEGVEAEVWDFHIGGYQVLEKWLKDRRGRELSSDDLRHYQRIVVALKETGRIMGEIDAAIEDAGGWPIQ